MDYFAIVFGVIAVSGIVTFLSFQISKEHPALRMLGVLFGMSILLIVPYALLESRNVCEVVVNSTTTTGNLTAYTHTNFCYDENVRSVTTLYKVLTWFYRIMVAYVIIYIFFMALIAFKESVEMKK